MMSIITIGKIKGFIDYREILNYIKQKFDINVKEYITKDILSKINKEQANEYFDDNICYKYSGFIIFKYNNKTIPIFYSYTNVNVSDSHLDNILLSEITTVMSFYNDNNVNIIKQIVAHFGGGWLDENSCDDISFYPIELNFDNTIKPVKYVTMQEIYDKFGCNVVIKDK